MLVLSDDTDSVFILMRGARRGYTYPVTHQDGQTLCRIPDYLLYRDGYLQIYAQSGGTVTDELLLPVRARPCAENKPQPFVTEIEGTAYLARFAVTDGRPQIILEQYRKDETT